MELVLLAVAILVFVIAVVIMRETYYRATRKTIKKGWEQQSRNGKEVNTNKLFITLFTLIFIVGIVTVIVAIKTA